MWYYNTEIIKTPKSLEIGGFTHPPTIFKDKEKLLELGIKPYREVMPDGRYFGSGAYTVDTSGDEVVGTYQAVGRDPDVIKERMLIRIKNILTSNLLATDWYYLRKLRTGTDVPSDIQKYSDTLYAEYDVKKKEIDAMTKISQIQEYENRKHTAVDKVKTTNTEGKTVYGPETTTYTREINMCMHWTESPDLKMDPEFVSLTVD
tara:strand:- start:41 stop:652 length:612 start_codon:yes stop_codon:yes gene_type:complete